MPLDADPRSFSWTDKLVFNLKVACEKDHRASRDAPEDERYLNSKGQGAAEACVKINHVSNSSPSSLGRVIDRKI